MSLNRTNWRSLLTAMLLASLIALSACVGSQNTLPTANPTQAVAQTALAEGTPVSTQVAEVTPESTVEPTGAATSASTSTQAPAATNAPAASPTKGAGPTTTRSSGVTATKPAGASPTRSTAATKAPTAAPNPNTQGGSGIPPAPPVKPLRMNSPAYSIQAFLFYHPEVNDRDLQLIRDMGFGWVKQGFAWRDIEGARKGAFDWSHADDFVIAANTYKIDILARIDNAPDWAAPGCFNAATNRMGPPRNTKDWTDFLRAFASRYKQRIRAYEIWNEPNLAREWCGAPPNPAAYAAFLKASYAAIKAVDPGAMIVSGGLTPTTCCADGREAIPDAQFFERMYAAMGNSRGYFDVLGVHAAGYKAEPEADPAVVAQDPVLTNHDPSPPQMRRIYSFRHVEDIRQIMVNHGDSNKQIMITEFGWTSDPVNPAYAWFRVDENTKADRIVRAYRYAKTHWAPWIGVMSLIYLGNPDWNRNNEQYWWAITEPNGAPRPAYQALKNMQK